MVQPIYPPPAPPPRPPYRPPQPGVRKRISTEDIRRANERLRTRHLVAKTGAELYALVSPGQDFRRLPLNVRALFDAWVGG